MKKLLLFIAVLIVSFSLQAQDCDSRAMLNAAQMKIGNCSLTTVKHMSVSDKIAMFEKDGGGFAIVKSDGTE